MMKNVLVYLGVAVLVLGLSTYLSWFVSRPIDDSTLDAASNFSREDVRVAVEEALDEHEAARLAKETSPVAQALIPIDNKLNDVRKTQRSLIERIDAVAQKPAAIATKETYVIPERERVEEIVGATILRRHEEEEKAERDREEKRAKERQEQRLARQKEQLTKELGLDGRQADDVMAVMAKTDQARTDFFTSMRDRFNQDGGDPAAARQQGFEQARESMRKMNDEQNAAMKNILNTDQYSKWEKYQESQMGGMRGLWNGPGEIGPGGGGAGGRRGGRGQGRGQGGGQGGEPGAAPATGNPRNNE